MTHIGIKIRDLRKKKDLTQEKLAEYLNVSFQAVSKWETGAASPDLSMIVPLARLLGVSTDELFGLAKPETDVRQTELTQLWEQTWHTGDTAKRYEIARAAVAEYPGNFEYLLWLAGAEESYAIHNCARDSDEQRLHFEHAIRYYERIIEDCEDCDTRNSAIYGIVMNLPNVGRRDEAVSYARQHPDANELLKWCLTGEEWEKNRQQLIHNKLLVLVGELEWGKHSLESIRAAERIIKLVVEDGNYLWFHETLMHNLIWQALCLVRASRYDEAVDALKQSYEHAAIFTELNERGKTAPIPYTCPILNHLSYDSNTIVRSGTSTLTEDFREYLTWQEFDALCDRDDFKALLCL